MKKLSDFQGQKIAIHFPNYELWLRRKEINPSDCLSDEYWNRYNKRFCYNPFYNDRYGGFAGENYYISNNYTILPATDFLEEEFVCGQEYEFSCDGVEWCIRKYMCKMPNGRFIAWNEQEEDYGVWLQCRKINTERNEAITTAKELITKFDIKQEEIY